VSMSNPTDRVEVITSVERRRRWSAAEKEQLVAASLEPGASVSAIAREAGIHPGQLYGWRRQLRVRQGIGFAPVPHLAMMMTHAADHSYAAQSSVVKAA
jgi:transposase-like protein